MNQERITVFLVELNLRRSDLVYQHFKKVKELYIKKFCPPLDGTQSSMNEWFKLKLFA